MGHLSRPIAAILISLLPASSTFAQGAQPPGWLGQLVAPESRQNLGLEEGEEGPVPWDARCPTGLYPLEGTYDTPAGWIELRYPSGDEEQCPTNIALSVQMLNGQMMWAVLSATGDSFTGSYQLPGPGAGLDIDLDRYFANAPTGLVRLIPEPMPTDMATVGLAVTDRFVIEADYTFPETEGGRIDRVDLLRETAFAPDCMCSEVRLELEAAQELRALYGNPVYRRVAREMNLRGNANREEWYLDGNQLQQFPGPVPFGWRYSYDDVISNLYNGTMEFRDGRFVEIEETRTTAEENAATPIGEIVGTAAATTNNVTCEINLPSPDRVRSTCELQVELEAFMTHEAQHRSLCLQARQMTRFVAPDGTVMEVTSWPSTLEAWPRPLGNIATPVSAYGAMSEDVDFNGEDEVAAYTAEISVYEDWLGRYCGAGDRG